MSMKTATTIAFIIATTSCVTFDPVIVHRARIRSIAEGRLSSCLRAPPGRPFNEPYCIRQSKEYCFSQGLEASCGVDGLWGRL